MPRGRHRQENNGDTWRARARASGAASSTALSWQRERERERERVKKRAPFLPDRLPRNAPLALSPSLSPRSERLKSRSASANLLLQRAAFSSFLLLRDIETFSRPPGRVNRARNSARARARAIVCARYASCPNNFPAGFNPAAAGGPISRLSTHSNYGRALSAAHDNNAHVI
jgi:hypothetical protein